MTADQDINETRLRSRQDYLAKREAEQLALLRRQVEEEADEEERLGDRLSKQERADFQKNRETLRLAEARNAIDEHRDGYILPDADYSNRSEVLTRKHKEKGYEKSEVQLWEEEQTKKVGAQVKRPERTNEEDYEFVFDESQNIKFMAQAQATTLDPEQRRLLAMLDEAETKAKTIQDTRKSLPIYVYKEQLKEAIRDNQILVVVAETGSGKTTQLTQFAAEIPEFVAGDKRLVCTQPRRVAAMSVAQRVSEELNVRLGKEVGYTVRFDSKIGETTKIEYCTEGILVKSLASDPSLDQYSVVILDEAHERSINTDILMAICKNIVAFRPDFRLILSSASLNAQKFSKYFGDAPLFAVPGRTFPVQKHFTTSPEANYLNAAVTTIFQVSTSQP
jgi:pre-mRNA-splicing factor ATP-dependent RNA helicase DHX16